MNLKQLDKEIQKICLPYVRPEDTNHRKNGISIHLYIEYSDGRIEYKVQFFIGRRHYHILSAKCGTPLELLEAIKATLDPKEKKYEDIEISDQKF